MVSSGASSTYVLPTRKPRYVDNDIISMYVYAQVYHSLPSESR